jgi:hypothetical protein
MNMPTAEQRQRFERLCLLRSLYARRGARDATSVMALGELSAYAGVLLAAQLGRADAARSAESTV